MHDLCSPLFIGFVGDLLFTRVLDTRNLGPVLLLCHTCFIEVCPGGPGVPCWIQYINHVKALAGSFEVNVLDGSAVAVK